MRHRAECGGEVFGELSPKNVHGSGIVQRHRIGHVVRPVAVVLRFDDRFGHTDRWNHERGRHVVVCRVAVTIRIGIDGVRHPVTIGIVRRSIDVYVDERTVVRDVADGLSGRRSPGTHGRVVERTVVAARCEFHRHQQLDGFTDCQTSGPVKQIVGIDDAVCTAGTGKTTVDLCGGQGVAGRHVGN